MRSQRQLKVGEEIRHALAMLFQRGDVPWPQGFKPPIVTISEVQVSPDLHNAFVFFTLLGDERYEETKRILNHEAGFFRHALAQAVRLRYVPKVEFKADTSFSYASNIDRILNDPGVAKDLKREDGTLNPDEEES